MKHIWRRFRPKKHSDITEHVTSPTLLQILLKKTPGAVAAQRAMDKHPGSYHTNKARLFELIDFNDSFVNLALSLSLEERVNFVDRLKHQMQDYCERVGSPMFSEEQFEAITKGLSREVAVYFGAIDQGYRVEMASRTQDAMGVDMLVTDPQTGRTVGIDCKSPSAYHYRIKDLRQQGRLNADEALQAETNGYAHEVNGHGREAVSVVLLRIDPNETGNIKDLTFVDATLLGERLRTLFKVH